MEQRKLHPGEYLANSVKRMEVDGVLVSDTRYSEPVFEGWHAHANAHFSLVLEGGTREERRKSSYDALPGCVYAYHPEELHRNRDTVHPSRNFCVELNAQFLKRYDLVFPDPVKAMHHPEASMCMINIYRESAFPDDLSSNVVHEYVFKLIANHSADKPTRIPVWAKRAKELIHDNWKTSLSLNEISEVTGVHPVTISKNFAKYYYYSIGDYTRMVRVQKSAIMMKGKRTNLTAVAHECGFFDQSHFIRVFRKFTGYSPLQFKKA